MKLSNRFREIDKQRAWLDHQFCVLCSSNDKCSLHHIKSTESDSILNSSMLCHAHHKHADGHNRSDAEFMSDLLQRTMRIVLKSGYELTEKDIAFYRNNIKFYNIGNEAD